MYNSGFRSNKRTPDGVGSVSAQAVLVQLADPAPTITSWSIQNSDDRALDPAGGQTVVVKGGGFTTGMTVTVGTTAIGAVTIVSSTQATFTSPAKAAGNYTLTMANANGQAAILVPGLAYSTVVTWTTPAGSIGTTYETAAYTESVVATADSAITYTLATGSLPPGATLNANGVITGTSSTTASPTTYSFSVTATDAELQDSTQSFTITVTPDVVTWVSPANNTSYSLTGNQAMANVSLSATSAVGSGITYTANALPTGVSLTGNVIYGTPTVAQTVSTLLTATANTTTRSSTETISWTVNLGDTYWPYVSLLLNGSTPTTTFINDASLNNNALTIAGDTKPNNFTPYAGNYYGVSFNGLNQNITVNTTSSGGLAFGTGDYTLEIWAYARTVSDGRNILLTNTGSGYSHIIRYGGTTNWELYYPGGSTSIVFPAGSDGNNKWVHHAIVRIAGSLKWYINGVNVFTAATSVNITDSLLTLGQYSSYWWDGYLSNFRAVKGLGVYTGNFTVPTSPLATTQGSSTNISAITGTSTTLLVCQSNRFIDNSSNASTVSTPNVVPLIVSVQPFTTSSTYATYGSAYFDGNGDYLTAPASSAFAFGTGAYTIEAWVNFNSLATYRTIFDVQYAGAGPKLTIMSTGALRLFNGSNDYETTATGLITTGTWYHIAWVRVSTSLLTLYINGTSVFTVTTGPVVATNVTGTPIVNIGYFYGFTHYMDGYISDLRIVNGSAVYTTNFTPPTAPLTAVTNTQLLTLQYNGGATNNGFVDQSSFNNIITRAGNTTQGTFSPYSQTGWSAYLSSSTIAPTTSAAFTWGTGDYTIEMWYNPSTSYAAGNGYLFDQGSNNTRVQLYNNYVRFFYNNGATELTCTSAGLGLTVGTWYHLAIVRRSGVITMYINGTACGTVNSSANETSTSMNIGNYGGGGYGFNGYISNFRAVKGTAVYTGNFTPSTTPLAPVAGTSILTFQSPRFVDNSPNNFALTLSGSPSTQAYSPFGGVTSVPKSYSNYFNGSTDYLNFSGDALSNNTADSTIEFWAYLTAVPTTRAFVINTAGNPGFYAISLSASTTPTVSFWYDSYSIINFTTSGTITLNAWHHIAVTHSYSTGVVSIFINGVKDANTGSGITTMGGGTLTRIATYTGTNQFFPGYISNLRITQGQILYTNNFTPPTAPLTATSYTTLLTCQSNKIVDSSANYFSINAYGSPAPKPYNPFGLTNTTLVSYTPAVNGGSMYFDGTGDYLTFASSYLPTVAGVAFTLEFWIYPTRATSSDNSIISSGNMELQIVASTPGQIRFDLPTGVTNVLNSGAVAVSANAWNHIALVRTAANAYTLYLNGVSVGTGSSSTAITALTTFGYRATNSLQGYISDLRATTGAALYTANFYPGPAPATPTQTIGTTTYASNLLLNGTSGGIIDYHSSNDLETVGNTQLAPQDPYAGSYYSNYSDGNGDYLTVPSAAWTTLTGTFTVECWIKWDVAPAAGNITGVYASGGWAIYNDGTRITPNLYGTGNIFNSTFLISSIVPGNWYHLAVTRDSSNLMTMWVNGVSVGSTTTATTYTQGTWYIFSYNNTNAIQGNISNLRVTNNCLYTTTFTPSTTPLTAVSGTQLLTCQSNKFVDNSTNNATLTATGTVAVKSINPFRQNTGKSLYFGTSTDYYSMRSVPSIANLPGDFTIECWVNPTDTSLSTTWGILDARSAGASASAWLIGLNSYSSGWVMNLYTGTSYSGTTRVLANQWTYCAWVRSGSTVTFYVNGVAGGTATVAGAITGGTTTVWVGSKDNGLAGYGTVGYIKDLRITKGVARYTTTFTPPTTPDQTN